MYDLDFHTKVEYFKNYTILNKNKFFYNKTICFCETNILQKKTMATPMLQNTLHQTKLTPTRSYPKQVYTSLQRTTDNPCIEHNLWLCTWKLICVIFYCKVYMY